MADGAWRARPVPRTLFPGALPEGKNELGISSYSVHEGARPLWPEPASPVQPVQYLADLAEQASEAIPREATAEHAVALVPVAAQTASAEGGAAVAPGVLVPEPSRAQESVCPTEPAGRGPHQTLALGDRRPQGSGVEGELAPIPRPAVWTTKSQPVKLVQAAASDPQRPLPGNQPGFFKEALSADQPAEPDGPVKIPLSGGAPADVRVTGQNGLVSIIARDAALNEVLATLADHQGLNIITGEDIAARVTVTLNDVPFEEALTQILSVVGYTWVRQGNTLLVTSIAADNKAAPEAQGRRLRVFPLNYVSAADMNTVVQGLLSPAGQSFVMESLESDNRKTQELLVVEDLPVYLSRIEQYVRQTDKAPRQVLIEAYVLSVELEDDAEHGVNFEVLGRDPAFALRTQGFADAAKYVVGTAPAFFFHLAATDLTMLIEALETTRDAKTLAKPKVLALNGQKARIQIGERLPYRERTSTETATLDTVGFLDVGVVLEVTPWITEDNQVLMDVRPKVSGGEILEEGPKEETTEVETALMLPDGYGMVIGGLIQEEDSESQQKIPIVGDLWLVGRLFQRREIQRRRSEIIIALVPHIVPYRADRQAAECGQFYRSTTPLTYGPLRQNPRSGEPRFPDAGQHVPLRQKTRHLRATPDRGPWCPEGSHESCAFDMGTIYPAQSQPTPLPEVIRSAQGMLDGGGDLPRTATGVSRPPQNRPSADSPVGEVIIQGE